MSQEMIVIWLLAIGVVHVLMGALIVGLFVAGLWLTAREMWKHRKE